ncbi:MAG: hypothetical protein HZB35_08560 [Nitrospirae bacterium]|nr:hypothetical protein [Nitrospirota bacterium]
MAVSPLLAPGALAAYTGVSPRATPPFRVTRDSREADRVTMSDDAKRLAESVQSRRTKVPDDFEARALTQKLVQSNQLRDFLTRVFQP